MDLDAKSLIMSSLVSTGILELAEVGSKEWGTKGRGLWKVAINEMHKFSGIELFLSSQTPQHKAPFMSYKADSHYNFSKWSNNQRSIIQVTWVTWYVSDNILSHIFMRRVWHNHSMVQLASLRTSKQIQMCYPAVTMSISSTLLISLVETRFVIFASTSMWSDQYSSVYCHTYAF